MSINLKAKLNIMAGVAIVAVVLLAGISVLIEKETTVGSDIYYDLKASNNFVADIAPPQMFMVYASRQVNNMVLSDAAQRKKLTREIEKHLEEFESAIVRWEKDEYLSNELKTIVVNKLRPQGKEYIEAIKGDVLNTADDAALIAGIKSAAELFKEHEAIVTDLVHRASVASEKVEEGAISSVENYQRILWLIVIFSSSAVLFCSVFYSKSIISSLGADPEEIKQIAQSIAKGETHLKIEGTTQGSVMFAIADMYASLKDMRAQFNAIDRIQAIIEFSIDGTILHANQNFLDTLGYRLDEIKGKHHSMFVDPAYRASPEYRLFWEKLGSGQFQADQYKRIGKNGKEVWIQASYTPVLNEEGKAVKVVKYATDITEHALKKVAAEHEMRRILGALETTTTNVMIADADRKIIYMNKSVEVMLRKAENDIRTALPHFSVDKIINSNMDIFHKNPAHQSKLLENLTTTYTSDIVVGKRHFRLVANPIFSKEGTRLGSVVEWLDRTTEVGMESEVNTIVKAAAAGNFNERLVTTGKEGFFLKLAEGLNELVDTADKGLKDVARVLGALAKGDLTERINADYAGTFGDLKNYCNETTESLTAMLGDIRFAADTIFTASSEIAQGNADLSSRTEQQAANLEETASSMEELTSTVKLNADNAKQANVLAEQASTVAIDGGTLIQQVVTTMNAINDSARKISDIIGVIDGIAFQTNILALNAAVEAARAGDQGRGFAVVASEVRTLAQRSANAAKDIKMLISDSVQKIESGNVLVGKSGNTMKEIVNAIKRVNDIMAEIAAASAEQSTGIEEVSTAVSQMDEMTQQNAALVEEAAAAAESLQSQAEQLNNNVSQFKLSGESSARAPAVKPRLSAPVTPKRSPATTKKLAPPPSAEDEWEQF
jgi:methyl-accepting chemotaxis protein